MDSAGAMCASARACCALASTCESGKYSAESYSLLRLGLDLRIGEILGGIVHALRLVAHNVAVVQLHHAFAHRVDDLLVVRGHHDGGAGAVDRVEHLHDAERRGRVQVAGRFVGQQDLRMVHVGARNRDALLLAARKLLRLVVLLAGESHGFEDLRHKRLDGGTRRADHLERERKLLRLVVLLAGESHGFEDLRHKRLDGGTRRADHFERECHVLPHGFVGQQLVVLEDHADRAPVLRHLPVGQAPQVVAGHADLARGRFLLAQQQAQQRGLARAGRTHEEHEIAAVNMQVYVFERRPCGIGVDLVYVV